MKQNTLEVSFNFLACWVIMHDTDFFFLHKIYLFKTVFQEHHQCVTLFGFRLNRWQRLLISIAGKEIVKNIAYVFVT